MRNVTTRTCLSVAFLVQELVSSLETKIDETEKKFEETSKLSEERLKQAMDAESIIVKLKTSMHRFVS